MHKLIKSIASVAVALAGMAFSTVYADAKEELSKFNQKVGQASGTFSQTVLSPEGRIKQQGAGKFAFSKPGKFLWNIQKPFPQLIVSNGVEVVTFDPDLEQASIRPAATALDSSPSALLFGRGDLDKLFNLTNLQTANGVEWLEAKPKKQDSLFDKILIGMKGGLPIQVEIHDSLGQVTRLNLNGWDLETQNQPSSFEFIAPEGVDVIRVN